MNSFFSEEYSDITQFLNYLNSFFVHEALTNVNVQQYLIKRNLSEYVCKSFGIGFAPHFQKTLEFLKLNNLKEDLLISSGVVFEKGTERFDLFSGRITFALHDPFKKIVGFSARIYTEEQEKLGLPKYINSTSSKVFQKSLLLYNLYRAVPYILKEGYAILVEGMMDVITLCNHGILNVVAPCGTSFTTEQAKLLKIYTNIVFVLYDNDIAGQESLPKVLSLLVNEKIKALPLTITGPEKDPDEFLKKFGVQPILTAISSYLHP
jgi:DNA primase